MLTPDYYNKFTCIADKCPITCCKEWKIAVDADTNRRWKKLLPPDNVPECRKNLSAYTTKKDGQHVIGLDAMHRCPFLDDAKLCLPTEILCSQKRVQPSRGNIIPFTTTRKGCSCHAVRQ